MVRELLANPLSRLLTFLWHPRHRQNLLINADHYTSLLPTSLLSTSNAAKMVSYVQEHMGAGNSRRC